MPGIFADDAGWQFMERISPGDEILDEQVAVSGVNQEVLLEGLEMRPGHGPVVVPPDGVFGGAIAHDEFVLRAAAGVAAGGDHETAAFGHLGFAPHDGEFVKFRGTGIPGHAIGGAEAEAQELGARGAVYLHGHSPEVDDSSLTKSRKLIKKNDVLYSFICGIENHYLMYLRHLLTEPERAPFPFLTSTF